MTREEAIQILEEVKTMDDSMYQFSQKYMDALEMAIEALQTEPCEDEYIKVPKKALKYRTAGMVAYNAEWLKNHFDIERAVICGEQQPCHEDKMKVLDNVRSDVINIADGKQSIKVRSVLKIIDKYMKESEKV